MPDYDAPLTRREAEALDEADQQRARAEAAEQERDQAHQERDEAQRIAANLREQLDRLNTERQRLQDLVQAAHDWELPRRDSFAQGYAAAVAILRDDERYERWWTRLPEQDPAYGYWQGPARRHLADYLETVGPDGPDLAAPQEWISRRRAQDVHDALVAAKPGDVFAFDQQPGQRVLVVVAAAHDVGDTTEATNAAPPTGEQPVDLWFGIRPKMAASPAQPAEGALTPAGQEAQARHASPNCACGINDAGQRYVDPICQRLAP